MPSMLAMLENNMPTYNSGTGLREQVEGLYDYLYQLMEQIRYSMRNIDPEKNFNQTAKANYETYLTDPIYAHLEDADGNILDLKVKADGLYLTCYGADGTPENPVEGSLSFTAREFNVFYHDEDGDWSQMTQTADKFSMTLYGEGGPDDPSVGSLVMTSKDFSLTLYGDNEHTGLVATTNGIYTEVYGKDGHSGLSQTAKGLWAEVYGEEGGPDNPQKGSLRLTANDFSTFMGKDGDWSKFTQKADGIYATVYGEGNGDNPSEGSLAFNSNKFAVTLYGGEQGGQKVTGLVADLNGLSVVVQGDDGKGGLVATASSYTTFVQGATGTFSACEQKANRIDWVVTSGSTDSTTFTLTDRMIDAFASRISLTAENDGNKSTLTISGPNTTLTSADISFEGMVTFSDLNPKEYGKTTKTIIDGGVIVANSRISAPIIDGGTIYGTKIYWGDTDFMYTGGWGELGFGSGYSDNGRTEIVCIRSSYGIKIECSGSSGIALTSDYVFCDCFANNFRVYVSDGKGGRTQKGLETLIRDIVAEEKKTT